MTKLLKLLDITAKVDDPVFDAAIAQCEIHIQQILETSTTIYSRLQQIQQAEQTLDNTKGFSAEYKQHYCHIMNLFRNSLNDSIHKATLEFKSSDIYKDKTTNSVNNLQLLCDKVENLNQNALYNNLYPKRLFSPDSPISYLDKNNRLLAYNGLLIDHQANIVNSYKEINHLLNQQGDCQNLIDSKSDFLRDYSQQAYDDSIKIRKSYNLKVHNILLMADYRDPMSGVYSFEEIRGTNHEQNKHETQRVIPNLDEGIEFLTRYIRQDDGKSNLASYSNDKEKTCYKELEKIPAKDRLCFAYLYLDALIKRQQELHAKYPAKNQESRDTPTVDETKNDTIIKEKEALQAAREQAAREKAARQSDEAWKQEIALKNVRRRELDPIFDELNQLKMEISRLEKIGQSPTQTEPMKTILDKLYNCSLDYLEGTCDKSTYVKEINDLISQKSTRVIFSKHEGWAKPIVAILVNVLIAACGLLTCGVSMIASNYYTGNIFYHPKTPSQVILASLQDTINQLNDTVNNDQSSQYK